MAGDNKTIKIAFAVDEQSARKAKTLVDDITRSVEKLVSATQRAGQAMGGLGGGVTNKTVSSSGARGGITHFGTPAGAGGKAGGGIVANLMGGDAGSIRQLITTTQQGFQTVTTSVSTFVDRAEANVKRLQRAIDALGGSMGKAMPSGARDVDFGSGPGGFSAGNAPGGPAVPGVNPSNSGGGRGRPGGGGGAPEPDGWGPGGKSMWGPGGWRGYVGDRVGALGNTLGLPGPMVNMAKGFAGRFGGAAAVGGAVLGAYEYGAGAFENQRAAQLKFTLDQPLLNQSRRAAVAAVGQNLYGAVQSRDVAKQIAFIQTMKNKEVMGSINNTTLQREQLEAAFNPLTLGGMAGNLKERFKGFVGNTYGDFMGWVSGQQLPEATKKNMLEMARENAMRNMPVEQAQKFQQAWGAQEALNDPMAMNMVNRVMGGALGRVQAMRSAGMSAGTRKLKDGSTVMAYEDEEQKLLKGGWTIGDKAAGHQQLLHVGAGYGKAVGPIGLISAGIGGLGNAAELVKMGGMLGGSVGAGGSFLKQVQRSIGRGGLDVAVGRDLFGGLSQQMSAGGMYGNGGLAAKAMDQAASLVAGGTGVPFDVAQQQYRMQSLMQGNAALGGFMNGSKAPLYQATSLMGAIGARGGYDAGAEMLMKMDPMQLQAIASGGPIPEALKGMVTQEDAQKFLKTGRKQPFLELQDYMFKDGSPQRKMLEDLRGSYDGDAQALILDKTKGMTGKAKAKEQDRLAKVLGGMLVGGGVAGSLQEGEGIVDTMLLGTTGKLKGHGVGAAAPKGPEAKALEDQAKLLKTESTMVDKLTKFIDFFIGEGGSTGMAKTAQGGVAAAAAGQGSSVESAAQDAATALFRMAAVMKQSTSKAAPQKAK